MSSIDYGPKNVSLVNLSRTRSAVVNKSADGPIFSLILGQKTVIVLADGNVIHDLVDVKGANYADRPNTYMRHLFENSRTVMRGYDDVLRLERKLYHAALNMNTAQKYIPYQELETLKLCIDLLDKPCGFIEHISRTIGSVSASITYGFRLPETESPETKELMGNSHSFVRLVGKSQLLDMFPAVRPILDIIPRRWNTLAWEAVQAYKSERAVFYKYYNKAMKGSPTCFAREIAASQEKWKGTTDGELLTNHVAAYIAGVSFEAGADTSIYTLQSFFKTMLLFPEAQKKAQQELDAVVGPDTLPSWGHLAGLPYLNAVAKETLRWLPVGLNGAVPHATSREDHYRGFRIPKGSTVILGVWAANHEEQDFPKPRDFIPERHVQDTSIFASQFAATPRERGGYGFGSGRRMCPGIHVATNNLLIAMARILWAFDIRPATTADGQEIPVDRDAIADSAAGHPVAFACEILPRSKNRTDIIRREWEQSSNQRLEADGNWKADEL